MILMALALAAAPTAEAQQLGRQVAESGTLAALLPLIKQKDVEELVAANPDLSDAEKAELRSVAERTYEQGRDRLMTATGNAYAERLSVEDMKALVAFQTSDAAKRYQAAMPAAIVATMQTVGELDFKKDVRAAFCKERKKLCDTK